ncbi:MAG TPA: VWA domain-containing protein [Flavitalea sp.]|nr:VWA domain-containing protein [Flavitalea sp.]
MHFQNEIYLTALAVLPLLLLLFLTVIGWKRRVIKEIGDKRLVHQLTSGHSPVAFLLKFFLICLSLASIILGIANLQKPGVMDKVGRKGLDVMIAMDVSKSMLAEDIAPNRLERAKQVIMKLIEKLPDDRVGLILFAGRAYMQMPLTTDHAVAGMYIQSAGPDIVPTQGTMISEALKMANASFNSKERKYKAIVLITDGEDHDPESLPLAEKMAANGVMINTIGIGSPQGAPLVDHITNEYKKDPQGNTVISKLNESILQQLASSTKGVYVHLNSPDEAVSDVMKQLGTIEATALEDNAFRNYKSFFQWFLGFALLLLVIELLLPENKWKVV